MYFSPIHLPFPSRTSHMSPSQLYALFFFKTTNLYIHRCGASTGAWLVNRPGTTLLKETDFPVLGSHQPSLSFSAKGEGLCVPSSNHTGMTGLIFEFTSAMIPLCPEDTVSPHLLPISPHAGVQEWRVPSSVLLKCLGGSLQKRLSTDCYLAPFLSHKPHEIKSSPGPSYEYPSCFCFIRTTWPCSEAL